MRKSSMARARTLSVTTRSVKACIESLEIRRLLATITVTSIADTITPDDGAVTLREAITVINAGNDLGDPNITARIRPQQMRSARRTLSTSTSREAACR